MKHEAVVLKKYLVDQYNHSLFEVCMIDTPQISDGEILVKCSYASVDPYMFSRIRQNKNYTSGVQIGQVMVAGGVGEVIETKNEDFKVGDFVESANFGWQQFAKFKSHECRKLHKGKLPIQYYLGLCGLPGLTAFLGLQKLKLEKQQTLIVTSAAGAVGQILGQLAKNDGIKVCGVAGSEEKVNFIRDELNFDYAINYHDKNWPKQFEDLKVPPANGFFDNVGGSIFEAVIPKLDVFAKILICGTISQQQGSVFFDSAILREFLVRRLTMFGFLVTDYANLYEETFLQLEELCIHKKINLKEHITVGLSNAPNALRELMDGSNFGKSLVKIE